MSDYETSAKLIEGIGASRAQEPGPAAPAVPQRYNPLSDALVNPSGYLRPVHGIREDDQQAEVGSSLWEGYGLHDFLKDANLRNSPLVQLLIAGEQRGLPIDFNYKLPQYDSQEWKDLTDGIPEEYWDSFGRASSAQHAEWIANKVREELAADERLMEYGGLPGYMAGAAATPEAIATMLFMPQYQGGRLARAMKMALQASAENVAIDAPLYALSDTGKWTDVAASAGGGFALGGIFGAFSRAAETPEDIARAKGKAIEAAQRDAKVLREAELEANPKRPEEVHAEEMERINRAVDSELDAREAELKDVLDSQDGLAVEMRGPETGDLAGRIEAAKRELDRLQKMLDSEEAGQVERLFRRINTPLNEREVKAAQALDLSASRVGREVGADSARKDAVAQVAAERRDIFERTVKARELVESLQKQLDRAERIGNARTEYELLRASRQTADFEGKLALLGDTAAKAVRKAVRKADRALDAARKPPEATPPAAPAKAGADSVGAARASDAEVEQMVEVASRFDVPLSERFKLFGLIPMPRWDYAWRLRNILREDIRNRVGMYGTDPMPRKGQVNPTGADHEGHLLRKRRTAAFYRAYEPAFKEWLKEVAQVNVIGGKRSRRLRRVFGKQVSEAVEAEGGDFHPSVLKAASQIRTILAEAGEGAKRAGVKGFEEFEARGGYFPRVPDRVKILASKDRYGVREIERVVGTAMRKAWKEAGIEFEKYIPKGRKTPLSADEVDGFFAKMARNYVRTLDDLAMGIQKEQLAGVRLSDTEYVAKLMRAADVDSDIVDSVIADLQKGLRDRGGGEGGTVRYAKGRALMDDSMKFDLRAIGAEGQVERVSVRDLLFHTDAEQVMQTYIHSMSGHEALARVADVKSKKDHEALLETVRRELPTEQAESVAEAMDDVYKLLTGAPVHDTNRWRTARRFMRALRDYQFARVMNMAGFANFGDVANFATPQYMRYWRAHFPDMFRMFNMMREGKIDVDLARQLEETMGLGTDMQVNKLYSAFDDELDTPISKIEHGLRVVGQLSERNPLGVSPVTVFAQRFGGTLTMNRMVDNVLGLSSDMDLGRLGLPPAMVKRIKKMMDDGGIAFDDMRGFTGKKFTKLKSFDLDKWTDIEARDEFFRAAARETRRLAQEEVASDTAPWMHTILGKAAIQFRRFGLVAYPKQFLYAAANADAEEAARLTMQVMMGSMSYGAQMYLFSMTMPEERQQEWREKYLTWDKILFGGIARAGMFSLTPALYSFASERLAGVESPFSRARSTGLASDIFGGIPIVDFVARVIEFGGDVTQSATRYDRQFDQRDFANLRRILLLSNMIGVKQTLDFVEQFLPEGDDDIDPDTAQFFFSNPSK